MPANVETMFSVRETPWHGIGTIVAEKLTAADALQAAGLTWTVEKAPLFAALTHEQFPTLLKKDERKFKKVREQFATVRTDTGAALGVVGNQYAVIQPAEAFAWCDSIIGDGSAKFETAGALDGGRKIWVNAVLPDDVKIAGESVAPYFVIANSYDGSSALKVFVTPIRVVCQNTLNLALGGARNAKRVFSVRHTANYEAQLAQAREALTITRSYFATFQETANALVAKKMTRAAFEFVAETLLKKPAILRDEQGNPTNSRALSNFDREFEKLMACYGADDLHNIRGTAWGALNAVADYADHGRRLVGAQNDREKMERLFVRSFADTDLKDQALELVRAL